jgi:hypothetical protein
MKPDYYYLESDGQVFLVRQGRRWRFPKAVSERPCKFKPLYLIPIENRTVLYVKPIL